MNRTRLGDLLIASGLISQEQLDHALKLQKRSRMPLGRILIEMEMVSKRALQVTLAEQKDVNPWFPEESKPTPDALDKIEAALCHRYQILPFRIKENVLHAAMRNPEDLEAIDTVSLMTGCTVRAYLADEDDLEESLKSYKSTASADANELSSLLKKAESESKGSSRKGAERQTLNTGGDAAVIDLVNQILRNAIEETASDIHIEPFESKMLIQYRVGGQMVQKQEIPDRLSSAVTARVKVMAELDIAEHRLPQDGRISASIEGRKVDLRVSLTPCQHGERIVMRILDRASGLIGIRDLGFNKNNEVLFMEAAAKPYGLMLVTGPTGSGKSTSLYALLKQLKNSTNTVLTCEDPIEYEIEGVGQSQINEKAGVGFSNLLRAALRQDPDIIMVGEIRDADTAQTAIRAALTGHLVLSTLHCNNAVAAIPRLLDIGVDPYLLSTCLVGVTAQRLIRTFNPDDRIEDNHLAHRKVLASIFPDYNVKDPIYTTLSMHEGYGRREAVHEVLPITPEVSKQIAANSDLESIRQAGIESGYEEMYLQALTKVREGATSVPEVMRMVSIPADHTRELTIERMAA